MPFELVPPGTHIDFIGKRRITAAISIALLLAGAIAVPIKGVQLGIDFQGGTEMQVLFEDQVDVDEGAIRNLTGACGIEAASVVRYGETTRREFLIRFQVGAEANAEGGGCPLTPEQTAALEKAALAGGGGGVCETEKPAASSSAVVTAMESRPRAMNAESDRIVSTET